MKTIHFNQINGKTNTIIAVIASISFTIGIYKMYVQMNEEFNNIYLALGFLLMSVFFLKMYYPGYYVGWNKKGITIRTKLFNALQLDYNEILDWSISNNILLITTKTEKKYEVNLKEVRSKDIEYLSTILKSKNNKK